MNAFQFPRLLNADAFINLLAEVKAVAIIKNSNAFFMPCVLRYASKEEECKIMKDRLSCPWIVRLKIQSSYQELYVPLPPAVLPYTDRVAPVLSLIQHCQWSTAV